MKNIRTDLALEAREIWQEDADEIKHSSRASSPGSEKLTG